MNAPLLQVRDLRVTFGQAGTPVRAVDGLDFTVQAGQTLAIVGESGCGKSATALALTRLLDAEIEGSVQFAGEELTQLSARQLQRVRGGQIGMVFQDPMSALNPVLSVGEQVAEALCTHQRLSRRAAWQRAAQLLERVHIPDAARRLEDYPHRFSGGMRQRVVIAMALAANPRLLIADEPTTALDVTIQAQILALLGELQRDTGMGLLLITHDLGVVAQVADRVLVMYAGRKVEEQPVQGLFSQPAHPYTQGLIAARPRVLTQPLPKGQRLAEIPGQVPMLDQLPVGCAFAPRCAYASAACATRPPLQAHAGAWVACHHPAPLAQPRRSAHA